MFKLCKMFFCLMTCLMLMGTFIPQVFSNQKYNKESITIKAIDQSSIKYDGEYVGEMARVPVPPIPSPAVKVLPEKIAGEPVDSWFNSNRFDFSINKLRLILPRFVGVTPESRLIGDINCHMEGFLKVSLDVNATITGMAINHSGLARQVVYVPDLSLKGKIHWDHFDKKISFENLSLGRAGIFTRVSGEISYQKSTALKLNLALPDTDIQKVLEALPYGLIPKIKGAQVLGTIGINFAFIANPDSPAENKFEPDIRVNNYSLLYEPAGIHIKQLKSDYTHEVRKNGVIVRSILLSKNNPDFVPYDQIGDKLPPAIFKAEDRTFFSHDGFDLDEMRQAMDQSLRARGFVRGGSTISMQVAKNLFLNSERTLSRKLQEAILTYALEKELSKERIFEIYANIIEWGVDVYGISEAAQHYFSKASDSLTAEEAARLASIIPSPQKRDFNKKDFPPSDKMIGQLDY